MSHEITAVDGDLGDLLHKSFDQRYCYGHVRVDGVVLPEGYKRFAEAIENFQVRDDDVWICTFPKTGTTWTQEMVWCIANDLDFERAKAPLITRFPFFEECTFVDFDEVRRDHPELEISKMESDSVGWIEQSPSPRFIKTHLPFHLLPRQIRSGQKSPRIVSVFRNAKDSCISYYHHAILLEGYGGSFEDFCKLFLGDSLKFAPFWTNVLSYWRKRILDNVLILNYEDMKRDLPSTIRRTAKFLGKNLTSDQVASLNEHLSFANMKRNPAVNNEDLVAFLRKIWGNNRNGSFIRSGTTDQWKSAMTPELVERFDHWIRAHLTGTRLSF